jgi:hypothetical protein
MSIKANNRAGLTVKAAKPAPRSSEPTITVLAPETVETIGIPVRPRLARTPSRHWKKNLEKNLIREGYTPAQARETVEIAAS